MLRPGRFARPAPVRTFTLELSLPLSPSGASSTTTRVHSQFPWLDSHQLDTQHYGLRTKRTHRTRANPTKVFHRTHGAAANPAAKAADWRAQIACPAHAPWTTDHEDRGPRG